MVGAGGSSGASVVSECFGGAFIIVGAPVAWGERRSGRGVGREEASRHLVSRMSMTREIPSPLRMTRRRLLIITALVSVSASIGPAGCSKSADPGDGDETTSTPHHSGPTRPLADPPTVGPEAIQAALSAADDYLNSNQLAKAEVILARLIERAPGEIRARELMGQVLLGKAAAADRRRDPAGAAAARAAAYEQYRVVVAIEPDSAGLQQSAGVLAMTAGRPDDALAHFREAGNLDPANPQHPLYCAQVLIQQKQLDAAAADLARVLALDADEPLAHASLAVIARERGRLDEALAHIREAREIAAGDLRFRVQEARILREAGAPRQTLALLMPLSADDRADPGVCFEIAAARIDLGEPAKAGDAWAHRYQWREKEPTAHLAAVRAGEAYLAAGRRDDARFWLEQARLSGGESDEFRTLRNRLDGP